MEKGIENGHLLLKEKAEARPHSIYSSL